MGVIDTGFAQVAGWFRNSRWRRSQIIDRYVELRARADIESARTELRLGNVARCEALLASAERRIEQQVDGASGQKLEGPSEETPQQPRDTRHPRAESSLGLVRAVVLTLRGQCERLRQRPGLGDDFFARAVDVFEGVPEDALSPRDRGDFGVALAARGRHKDARAHLEAAVAVDGDPPEHARELARVYLEVGRPNKAEQPIEEALLALPADPELRLLRAEVQKARRNPLAAGSFVYAGGLLLEVGRERDALRAFEQAEILQPGVATGLRAESLRLLGRSDEALEAFDAAVAAGSDDSAWLLVRRAAARMSVQDWEGASADLEHALRLAPKDADVLVLAGQIQLAQPNPEAASRLAAQALVAEPGNWQAIMLGARARWDVGDLDGALELVRSAAAGVLSQPALLRLHTDIAFAAGLHQEAIERLERLQTAPRADARDAFQYADALANDSRLGEAWAVTTRGLATWSDNVDLRTMEIRLALARGDREVGLTKARELAMLAPESAVAHLLKAVVLLDTDPPWDKQTAFDALAAADRSAELAPQWAEPWWVRAAVLQGIGDLDGVRAALSEVFARDPKHREAHRLSVELELEGGDLDRAEELARAQVSDAPGDIGVVVQLAQVLWLKRESDEALSLLRDPKVESSGGSAERADRLLLRAQIQVVMWKLADAANDLETAAGLDEDRVDIWTERAAVARYLGDAVSAKRYAVNALSLAAGDFDARTELAAAHLMQDEPDQAELLLEQLERERPGDVRVGLLHVQAIAARRPEQARAELAHLAEVNPSDIGVVTTRAQFALDTGAYKAALALLEDVPGGDRELDILALRAETCRLLGQPAKAIRDANRCLEQAPEHADALATLGLALLDTGEDEQAVEVLERARTAYPDDPLVRARLGQGYVAVDRYGDALQLLDEAASAAPRVTARLAEVLSDIGLFDEAATLCRRVLAEDENDAASWNLMGWSLQHLDPPQVTQAEEAYGKAVELDADLWNRKNLANVVFLRGEHSQAREVYQEVLREALGRRSEHVTFLSLAGWCHYRLDDLAAAARLLYEATSTQKRTDSDHFDLALVHVCDGRIRRGAGMYENIIPLTDRDPQRRRGLLLVALRDLHQAAAHYPDLARSPDIDRVVVLMTEAIASVSPPPEIRALAQPLPAEPEIPPGAKSSRTAEL